MQEFILAADAVVCHAGVGTIMTVLESGRRPVVIPRLRRYGEHVDDHQQQLATELESSGIVVCYKQGDSLSDLITATQQGVVRRPSGDDALGLAVGAEVSRARFSGEWPRRRRGIRSLWG
jgi:UDP-N-acetylglucosamine transferase subunit ALG13